MTTEPFDIAVTHEGVLHPFTIIPNNDVRNAEFEVRKFNVPLFVLGCCTDSVGDTLKLIREFAPVDMELVAKVANIIESEEE